LGNFLQGLNQFLTPVLSSGSSPRKAKQICSSYLQFTARQKKIYQVRVMASHLLGVLCMGWICQHCDAPFVDPPYRVKSEESGTVLLDLIVCHRCHVQARELGLRTEKIEPQSFMITGLNGGDEKKA
jgi:hypothetical protein